MNKFLSTLFDALKILALTVVLMAAGLVVTAFAEEKKAPLPLEELKLVAGDESGNEVKAVKTELMIAKAEQLAIEQMKKLIQKHRGTAMEPGLWFRLAELYMRRSKTERFFELHRQSETVVSLAPRLVKKASSRHAVTAAINIYESIQKRFPGFRDMDLVMFNNAFARQGIGQGLQAEKIYWELIKKFPHSDLVPDCHLSIGELTFDRKKFKLALDHFLAIEKYPESRVYPYGLYKAGWTYYNLHKTSEGLKKLEEVVAYGRKVAQEGLDSRLDLRREALYDMTLFYEDVYTPHEAYAYFSKQSSELDVEPVLMKLSKLYERHSKWNEREIVLRDILSKKPKSDMIPEVYNEIVLNYEQMKNKPSAVAELNAFYKACQVDSSWSKFQMAKLKNSAPSEAQEPKVMTDLEEKSGNPVEQCKSLVYGTSQQLAGKWLRTFKKNPAFPEFAEAAEKAFEVYLRDSRTGQEVEEARFAYAELLFQRQKYRQASQAYAQVSSGQVKGSFTHDASYAALLSLEKAVKDKWSDEDEKNFHSLAQVYVTQHPKGKYRLDVEFKGGLIAYDKGKYEEAAPVFLTLGRDYPKEEKGLKAQDLYLDILNIKKDYKGLREYTQELLAKNKGKDRGEKLKKIYQQAYFLEIQSAEEKGNFQFALTEYRKFSDQNKDSDLAEKALWNSFQLHFKLMDYAGGADAGVVFYERYPKSSQAVDALLRSAQAYENMGQLSPAAEVLEKLVVVDAKDSWKWKMLAADFSALSGQAAKAKRLYGEIKAKGPEAQQSLALEKLFVLEENNKSSEAYKQIYAEMIRAGHQPQASLAQLQVVEQLFTEKNFERAFIEAKKVLSMSGKVSKYAQSRARFLQARILEEEFLNQSVKARPERVGMVLAIKTEKLDKAQTAFQAAIRYGDPTVAVESLERLSGLYTHYVEALRTMPMPEGLTPQDQQVFKSEMDRLAIPLEEKGVDTMAQALNSAKKFELRDGTIHKLQKRLDALNMKAAQGIQLPFETPGISLPVPQQGVGS